MFVICSIIGVDQFLMILLLFIKVKSDYFVLPKNSRQQFFLEYIK